MKTSVSDLREHLFLQLERLKDDANGEEHCPGLRPAGTTTERQLAAQ